MYHKSCYFRPDLSEYDNPVARYAIDLYDGLMIFSHSEAP